MRAWRVAEWGIRNRVLLLAVTPVFFVTVLLGTYFAHVRLDDVRHSLEERGRLLAQHLAPASEFGLFSGNRQLLKATTDAAVRQPDVYAVTVVDVEGRILVRSISPEADGPQDERAGLEPGAVHLIAFSEPVHRSGVEVAAFSEQLGSGLETEPEVIGWVVVGMHKHGLAAQQRDILLNTLLIVAAALALSILLARRIGRGVAEPVVELHRMVTHFGRGHLDARVAARSGGELGQLERGFNEMAERLQHARRSLEERVSEATRELRETVAELERKNEELEAARKAALRAGQEKAEFLANMSHEIRTPVNALVGFSNLLGETALGREQQEYAATIRLAAQQLTAIIDDILDFSKLEAGSIVPERIPFPVRKAVEDVTTMLRPAAHEKRLELALLVEPAVPDTLLGDPSRLRQVVTNLVNNAIKFTPAGSVEITVDYDVAAEVLWVAVRDTGIGIDEAQRSRLFQAFSQGDPSISRRFGGTGLGLVIAERLVRLMGGEIGVASRPGEGSCFTVTVPLAPAAGGQAGAPSMIAGRALLSEPHPFTRRATATDLERLGLTVDTVPDDAAAVAALRAAATAGTPYAVVVAGGDEEAGWAEGGGRFLESVRVYHSGPVLFLAATDMVRWIPEAVGGTGTVRCLAKPPRLDALAGTLHGLLAAAAPLPAAADDPGTGKHIGKRFLVAEDNSFNRALMTALLGKGGVQVVEAVDGEEAAAAVAAGGVDLVFMDIHMPGVDGIEATRRIKASGAEVPVVALTADVFDETRERMLEAGVDDWLFKPIQPERLWELVDRWAGTGGTAAPRRRSDGTNGSRMSPALWERLMKELPRQADALERAYRGGDEEGVRKHAHELHGLAGYFGIAELADAARRLEATARRGELAAVPELLAVVQDRIQALAGDG